MTSEIIWNIGLQSLLNKGLQLLKVRMLHGINTNFDFPLPCVTKIEFGNSDARLLDEVEGTVISKIEKL